MNAARKQIGPLDALPDASGSSHYGRIARFPAPFKWMTICDLLSKSTHE
jgi:hypothetical protein